jgi:hypothetical protein
VGAGYPERLPPGVLHPLQDLGAQMLEDVCERVALIAAADMVPGQRRRGCSDLARARGAGGGHV